MRYYYYIWKSSRKKWICSRVIYIVLDYIIVKGCVLFVQEETGYSYLFPMLVLQCLTLIQSFLLLCFYQKELFEMDAFYIDRFLVKKKNIKKYEYKQRQIYFFQAERIVLQIAILMIEWLLYRVDMEILIILLGVHIIAFFFMHYIFSEIWIAKCTKNKVYISGNIIRGAIILSLLFLLEWPHIVWMAIIGILMIIKMAANKRYLRKNL